MAKHRGTQRSQREVNAEPVVPDGTGARSTVRARTTVVVGELRGFSRVACKLDAESAVALLGEFFRTTSDVAVAQGATIDRVVGDVFVLLFRGGGLWREDCARGVRTALSLQRAFLALRNRWRREGRIGAGQLEMALGVASGALVLAEVEGVPGLHNLPFGEAMARAGELCQQARPAEVLVDAGTYTGAKRMVDREVTFTSREIPRRGKEIFSAYQARMRRSGLRVVSKRLATDPVCGADVKLSSRTRSLDYGGAVFHFCSTECADRFAADPPSWVSD